MNEKVKIITNEHNWMEQAGIDQLMKVAEFEGVERAVGLPDLHPGRTPVGMALLCRDRIYPHLIGNDIGCGMSLFETGVKLKKYKENKWVTLLNHIRELGDIYIENPYEEESPIADLGTIGSGNHFVEFQAVHSVENKELFEKLALDKEKVMMLIHSGSRGYGQRIFQMFDEPKGFKAEGAEGKAYLAEQSKALLWAQRNRTLTAVKLMQYLGVNVDLRLMIECCHNYVEQTVDGFLHRKGAISSQQEYVVIPGSRGSLTYICMPTGNTQEALYSLSHGAGRKWSRSMCKSRINQKYDRDSIRTTVYKSRVVCHDTNLLYQEAPEAYKNIEQVMKPLLEHGLIEIVATLKPLITYKG